jgi:hypothetical protein
METLTSTLVAVVLVKEALTVTVSPVATLADVTVAFDEKLGAADGAGVGVGLGTGALVVGAAVGPGGVDVAIGADGAGEGDGAATAAATEIVAAASLTPKSGFQPMPNARRRTV